ncbi:ABC transporter permease [Paenibacillus filicis]|uniref:ABC transporter permease n=1 Tax=Paenibacillus filicis TaxID=669464 RepID=A0ABU9DP82_9BACL
MANIALIAWTHIKMISRVRVVIFVMMVFPLLLIVILGSALSESFGTVDMKLKPVKITVVNLDQGIWNERMLGYLHSPELEGVLEASQGSTREEAVERLRTGSSEFAVVIPAGFGAALQEGGAANWELIAGKNRQQNLIAQTVLSGYLDRINYTQATAIAAVRQGAQPAVEAEGGRDRAALIKLGRLGEQGHRYTAMQYYASSMLIMFMLYSGMMLAITLVGERESHTLARLSALPVSMNQIAGGKMLGHTLLTLLQAALIIVFTQYVYGVDWGDSLQLLAANCLAVAAASMSIAMIVTAFAKSIKAVTGTFQFVIIIMTFLSGGFTADMPQVVELLGRFTVNQWAMQSLLHLMIYEHAAAVQQLGVLAAIAAGLVIASGITYWKVGYRE